VNRLELSNNTVPHPESVFDKQYYIVGTETRLNPYIVFALLHYAAKVNSAGSNISESPDSN